MRKIGNWDEIKDTDEVVSFDNLPVGPQICKILKVEDVENKEYLKMEFDIMKGDYSDHFREQFDNNTNADKKWPNAGTLYRSYKKSAERFFASFITAVEKSNDGFKWDWDEKKLVNKYFVANFAEEEYVAEGEVKVSIKCREVRSLQALKENLIQELPLKKLTNEQLLKEGIDVTQPDKKVDLPIDDDLPF